MANTKYREEYIKLVRWMARAGLTDKEIAEEIGIQRSTLNNWKKRYPEFAEALKQGKDVIDDMVEDALLKRALGYEYEETKIIAEDKKVKQVVKTKKSFIPDTTAQIFWLKNRRPDKWRDRRDIEHAGNINHNIREESKRELIKALTEDKKLAGRALPVLLEIAGSNGRRTGSADN